MLEDIKRVTGIVTGLGRPDRPEDLTRVRKPNLFKFEDDGLIPNHPKWPLILYRSAVRRPVGIDPAAIFEELFQRNGWGEAWRDGIYPYVHYHSRIHEVLGIARGSASVQFGGPHGRKLRIKSGDVAILPAGTGHQCFEASNDFLVVGAYPRQGTYNECTSIREHRAAIRTIPKVPRPGKDPVYGKGGPLLRLWKTEMTSFRTNTPRLN